ncbi:MAG: PIN/TRAM domain-containing protein, partial [bacterium]|nr:PIN/TRAM domain-containing protein [bacterium]
MSLWILRSVFVVVSAGVAITLIFNDNVVVNPLVLFLSIMGVCGLVIAGDVSIPRKPTNLISSVYFGTLVGLLLAWILGMALEPLFSQATVGGSGRDVVRLVLGVVMVYACTSLLMQTRDDLRFIIPYIEFAREVKGNKPFILDTSSIIDGRIAEVV